MIRAQKQAEKASVNGEHRYHQIGAVISYGRQVVATGWNKAKTHPRSTHEWKFLHAEMDAIIKARNCEGADLYVARIGRDGTLRNAKPCPACMALIVSSGIRRVHFTDNNQWNTIKIR